MSSIQQTVNLGKVTGATRIAKNGDFIGSATELNFVNADVEITNDTATITSKGGGMNEESPTFGNLADPKLLDVIPSIIESNSGLEYALTPGLEEGIGFFLSSGVMNMFGAVLTPNREAYILPCRESSFMKFNSDKKTITYTGNLFDRHTEKFMGGVLANNGKIYTAPSGGRSIIVIDPNTDVIYAFGNISGNRYRGGVLAPNGKIYFIPSTATKILVVTPYDISEKGRDEISYIDIGGGFIPGWFGGTLAPNGKIYCSPHQASDILVIDTADDFFYRIDTGIDTGLEKWGGCVLAPNGQIYFLPFSQANVMVLDPQTDEFYMFDKGLAQLSAAGGVLAPNGKIYCAPVKSDIILVIDPSSDTTDAIDISDYDLFEIRGLFCGATLMPNGDILFVPNSGDKVICLSPNKQVVNFPMNMLLSAYYNKL